MPEDFSGLIVGGAGCIAPGTKLITGMVENQTVVVTGISNREFIERYAQPGRVGLCGGTTRIDLAIRHAQRHLQAERRWSDWSHAFVFEGKRADDQQWVLESDIQILRRNIQLGVQENRADKYHDEKMFPTLAVLDFGLGEARVGALMRAGLDRWPGMSAIPCAN